MNTEKQINTWADYYRNRVSNRDYRDSFRLKYSRFIDEIILQVKRLNTEGKTPLVLKEEGCGIGSVVRSISERERCFLEAFGIKYSEIEDRLEIEKIILSDTDNEMLTLCMENTRCLYIGEYLAKSPFFYTKENILNPKFFEPNTVVLTHGVLEHFSDDEIKQTISTYNDNNIVFQAHYVPTNGYEHPSFGDERLLPVSEWIELVKPDYYIVDNNGLDLYMFKIGKP